MSRLLAVVCDCEEEAGDLAISTGLRANEAFFAFEKMKVSALTVRSILRQAVASRRFSGFVNMCGGSQCDWTPSQKRPQKSASPSGKASARQVAKILEEWNAPYIGVRCADLSHQTSVLRMLAIYADVKVPNFVELDATKAAVELPDISQLKFPVRLVLNAVEEDEIDAFHDEQCNLPSGPISAAELSTASVENVLSSYPKILIEEFVEGTPDTVNVVAFVFSSTSSSGSGASVHIVLGPGPATIGEASRAVLEAIGKKLLHGVANNRGYLLFRATLPRSAPSVGSVVVSQVSLNPGSACLAAFCPTTSSGVSAGEPQELLVCLAAMAQRELDLHAKAQPNFKVSFDGASRFFFMRATRNIDVGEAVFADEGRMVRLVTRPFVEETWSVEEKDAFARYAWPIDEGGHVYGLWDDNPRNWRPINHSCDPNLFFAAPHSLNVVARRKIREGEDLTLDYATFLDSMMKPFDCACGAACCRGKIVIDTATTDMCALYGQNTWRRNPSSPASCAEPTQNSD